MITEERLHRVALPAYVAERIALRRGTPHAFEKIDPARTALVVVDLQNGFMAPGQPAEMPVARAIVPNVNRLAEATRKAGGAVVWIKNIRRRRRPGPCGARASPPVIGANAWRRPSRPETSDMRSTPA